MSNNNVKNIGIESSSLENQELSTPEELFAEIIKSSIEYTTEKPEILLSKKSKILAVLKTHRPIKITDYQYGLTIILKKNGRLIVFEWDNKRMVREYSQRSDRKNVWECRACMPFSRTHLQPKCFYLHFVDDMVFVPKVHKCLPRDYQRVMQFQKFLEEGDTAKARSMLKTVNFTFGQDPLLSVINVVSKPSDENERINVNNSLNVTKTSASLKRKSNESDIIMQPSVSKKYKLEKHPKVVNDENEIPSVQKTKANKQLLIINEPGPSSIQKSKDTVENNQTEPSKIFLFQIPSTFQLQEICKKLAIKYCKEAREFWKEIHFRKIDPSLTTANIKTQKFKTKNFYKILSNFFTRKFCDYGQIYYAINSEFSKKLVSDGQMSYEEIDALCSSYTVTDQHLKFIAKYIPCRILIFDQNGNKSGGLRRFGKWKNDGRNNNILTLVLSFSKRKYSVVIDL